MARGRRGGPGAAVLLAALLLALLLGACDPSTPTNFDFVAAETDNTDFAPVEFTAVGNLPATLAAADIDGDGDTDIVVANRVETLTEGSEAADPEQPGSITLLFNDGAGGLTAGAGPATGARPATILVGEFNGDGAPDFALLDEGATAISVYLNDGSGAFSRASIPLLGTAARMALADLNGDGSAAQDIVVSITEDAEPIEPGNVTALVNDGGGAFTRVISLTEEEGVFTSPGPILIEDWNGDGWADVAVGDFRLSRIAIMFGDGAGGFAPGAGVEPIPVGTFPFYLIGGDFSAEGNRDIIVTPRGTRDIWLIQGDGLGGFAPSANSPIDLVDGGGAPERMLLGNFTPDGNDLVVVQRAGTQISLFDWSAGGGFALSIIETSRDPFAVVQGDFNRDGDMDLLTAERQFRLFSVHAGAGNGTFQRTVIGFDVEARVPAVVDLNGDGGDDVIFLQPNSDRLGVLLNCHPAAATACP